ncbi:MAG: hypothetical protein N3G19_03740, partial [Candidatus Pacearchaeota archaeon]|nr:hypothetical protein [Candidatus Pacearchaeota archaeon]
ALSYYASPEQKRPGFEGTPTMSNLGYVWIHLKRQPVEEKMPDKVVANMSVKIVYDVARTYGINEHQFVLPLLEEEEWRSMYKNYGFWRGKGYLRLQEITGLNNAKIAIYSNPNQAPYAIRELRAGVVPSEKDEIPLPGFYCGAGINLKLDEISVPKNRVRLLVNGNELLVSEGELIQDSGCVVYSISPSKYSYGGSAIIRCGATDKKVLTLRDFRVVIEVDGEEREVNSGSEIVVEKGDKKKYLYVGFLGREYSKEGLEDSLIIFTSKNAEGQLSEKAVKTTTEAIYSYVLKQRGKDIAEMPSSDLERELKAEVEKKDKNVAKQLGPFYLVQRRASREIAGIQVAIKEVSGPEQAHYSDEVEKIYKEAIQEYRDVAFAYSTKQHPEGMYYGVIALHEAANLAAQLHKKIDQVDLLRELIDKYSDHEEPEIVAEVEEAREELRRAIAMAGDNSVTFSRPNGNYFIQLVSVEKPSLAMLSADIEVDGEIGTYGIGDEIGGWEIVEIKEDSILLQNKTGHSEVIAVGLHKYLDNYKTKLLSTLV